VTVKPIECGFCTKRHGDRWLCDPAKAILDGMAARAAEVNMPVLDFAEAPIPSSAEVIMRQLTIQGGNIETAAGAKVPVVMLGGLDQHSRPLPRWMYPGLPHELEKAKALFASRVDLAIASVS
jgi:hypothetical protein